MRVLLILLSLLPFWFLHLVSRFLYLVIYLGLGYRRKVVRENLLRSFPNESEAWRLEVERKFYQNFCDIMIESIKTTTISRKEMLARVHFKSQASVDEWNARGLKVNGLCAHLGNWEWLPTSLGLFAKQDCYAIYKPLSNEKINAFMKKSRERFGFQMIPIKQTREFLNSRTDRPYILGLASDQAPHDYSKAWEIEFLNQKTYYVPGPGVLSVKYNLAPAWACLRRVGRSRFEWELELMQVDESSSLTPSELSQIGRMAMAHEMSLPESEKAYRIVKEYSRLLELQIQQAPADWLWTHRRWKKR